MNSSGSGCVDGPSRPVPAGARIHEHLVAGIAERVRRPSLGLEVPAPTETNSGRGDAAPPDPGRRQIGRRALDAIGDPPGEELLVSCWPRRRGRHRPRRAVRVRRRNQDTTRRQPRRGGHQRFRALVNFARDHRVVDHDNREARPAVVKHDAAGMQLVVHARRPRALRDVAVERGAERRSDVARRRAGPKDAVGGRGDRPRHGEREDRDR